MGAFFLYDKSRENELDLVSVRNTFSDKGFTKPEVFQLGRMELCLYKKQLLNVKNYYTETDKAVFVVGTIVYKGLGYQDTIQQLLSDYTNNEIDFDQLIGNYCVIFWVQNRIHILNDALNVYELFTDVDDHFITSSFLAAANARNKLTIDRLASLEKLLTGYIVGQNTLFNEVKRIIPKLYAEKEAWSIHKWEDVTIEEEDKKRNSSVIDRANVVRNYLKTIKNLAEEFKPELGLSGGYDSRLIFAASQNVWPFKLEIHTHSTEGVTIHDVEKEIVKKMAHETGTVLNIVPTHNLDYYSEEEIESILKDGYYYFDGRCAYNMGAFSPTYTRKYKCDTANGHGLTLNGLGGEVYRNYYMNIKPLVSVKQWMKAKVYPDGIDYVIDKKVFEKLHSTICGKMSALLPFEWRNTITAFQIRRYYSEMRMPDCDALNCNAANQMEFYLTPFIEKTMIEDAYRSRQFFGLSGEFQADMITRLSPEIAAFNSHYGFPFDRREPFKYKVYMCVRGILPDRIWNRRVNRIVKNSVTNNGNKQFFERVRTKSEFLNNAAIYTERLFPEIDFDYLRTDYAMMPNSSYISVVFYMLKDRIDNRGKRYDPAS